MISVTQNAAEHIRKIQASSNASDKGLRVAAVGGGCSGYQYQLGFDTEYEGDSRFESHGVTILVDSRSLSMLDGVEIDFVEGLDGASFVFKNPNAKQGCGCGKSFNC